MYKRNEVVEEEHLKWDKKTKDIVQEKDVKVTLAPELKPENLFLNEKIKKNFIGIPDKKISIIRVTKEITSNMGEKTIFFLILIVFPYLLGLFLFFILVPFLSGLNFNILFSVIDFFDWVIHFLFFSIGYITLAFSGFSFLLYNLRH